MASQLKNLCLLLLVLSAFGAHRAQAEGRPKYGQSVVGSLLEEPRNLDPVAVKTHTDMFLVSMIFDTLYRVEGKTTKAHLAYAMPDASDPLHVRVPIRPGVLFNNGHRLRAQDVLQSLERLRKSSMYHYMGSVTSLEVVTREADGVEEVVFHLRTADPQLARRLSNVHTSISEKGKIPTWRSAVGTGPFRIKERITAQREVKLEAFDRHFAGRSYVDEVRLRWYNDSSSEARLYETGGSQLSSRGAIAFAGHKPKFRTTNLRAGAWILSYLGFGKAQAIISEPEFRAAVSSAISRKGMSRIGSGELTIPTVSPAPSALLKKPSAGGLTADKRKTARLMASLSPRYPALDAGSLALELIVNKSRPDDALIGARVAAALFAFGIRTRIVSLSASAFYRRVRNGKYDIRVGQFAVSSPFIADVFRASFTLSGKRGSSKSGRMALERSFALEMPIIPLFHRGLRIHHRSDLYGLSFAPISATHGGTRLMYENLFLLGSPERN